MRWNIREKKILASTSIFEVEELHLEENGKAATHPYYRLNCTDWVNVLPITRDGKAILVRQYRAGSFSFVLETPGGGINLDEFRDPTQSALRELEEETGYTSRRILSLAAMNPNPALQTNKVHFFLALDCEPATERRHFPDEEERIEVVLVNPQELDQMVRFGQIDHSLSALCILLANKYVAIQPSR